MTSKRKRPSVAAADKIPTPSPPPNSNGGHPLFCFQYLRDGFGIEDLSNDQQAKLALGLGTIARYSWQECTLAPKHSKIGTEVLDIKWIKRPRVLEFPEVSKYLVFRYTGANHPVIGVRDGNVFHALWIEREFGDVYDHG